jgi:hypothetical protein
MTAFLERGAALVAGASLALGAYDPAAAQVKISSLPAAATLAGGELIPAVQGGADVVVTPNQIKTFTGGGGGTPGGAPGQLQYNNAAAFGGFTLAGDCTIAVPTITCLKTNGATLTAVATASAVNGITLAMEAQAAANTMRGNPTGATANVQDVALPSCAGAGNYLAWAAGTGFTCVRPVAALAVKPANPAATTSTTLVMAGIGGAAAITPAATGRLLVTISGDAYPSTAATDVTIGLYYGTGGAPANGAAVTGTALGNAIKFRPSSLNAGNGIPFSLTFVAAGLTVSTAYWIDLALDTSAGADAANLENLSVTAVEF